MTKRSTTNFLTCLAVSYKRFAFRASSVYLQIKIKTWIKNTQFGIAIYIHSR